MILSLCLMPRVTSMCHVWWMIKCPVYKCILTSARRYCNPSCLLVGWLILLFVNNVLGSNISKMVGDRDRKLAYAESNGHMIDVPTWHLEVSVLARYTWMQISRKLAEIEARFWRTTYRKCTNSAFHPSRVGKSSTSLLAAGVKVGHIHLCWVTGNTVIPYGRWRPVAWGRILIEGFIRL